MWAESEVPAYGQQNSGFPGIRVVVRGGVGRGFSLQGKGFGASVWSCRLILNSRHPRGASRRGNEDPDELDELARWEARNQRMRNSKGAIAHDAEEIAATRIRTKLEEEAISHGRAEEAAH